MNLEEFKVIINELYYQYGDVKIKVAFPTRYLRDSAPNQVRLYDVEVTQENGFGDLILVLEGLPLE